MTDELKIPPPCFVFMEGDILEVTDTSMRVKFPVKPEYQNPFGYMQGGFLVAAMDNTIGPLSFIVADPSVTIQLNTSFIRPVTPQTDYIIVEAWLKEKTALWDLAW